MFTIVTESWVEANVVREVGLWLNENELRAGSGKRQIKSAKVCVIQY